MLEAQFIDEVELEFGGGGRHVDIRYGILNHGTLDGHEKPRARQIKLGVVGLPGVNDEFLKWLDECSDGVEAKDSNKHNLFPPFPGFGSESCFRAAFECEARSRRILDSKPLMDVERIHDSNAIVEVLVGAYITEIAYLADEVVPDVIVCLIPDHVSRHLDRAANAATPQNSRKQEGGSGDRYDFHDLLKARAMEYRIPIQLVLPSTFGLGASGKSTKRKHPSRETKPRSLQDSATRAWNLFTALYYKSGGTPWRLIREATEYTTCYVGVTFYKSLDQQSVSTSIAQMFNERGEGIVIRGANAISKEDRTPHLREDDASALLLEALGRYRSEHKSMPARVVLHKSSYYTPEELAGFRAALNDKEIDFADMLSIRDSSVRLFREGIYPVLRGTHLSIDDRRHLLYTRGSVPFYETYTGLYVPRALDIGLDSCQQSRETLCREILGLTKMNWNSTQFDRKDPITIGAARNVGSIMKYIPLDRTPEQLASRYSFYM